MGDIRVGIHQVVGDGLGHLVTEVGKAIAGKAAVQNTVWVIDFSVAHHMDDGLRFTSLSWLPSSTRGQNARRGGNGGDMPKGPTCGGTLQEDHFLLRRW